jgi:hypothetical protein
LYQQALSAAGYGEITTQIVGTRLRSSTSPRYTTSSTERSVRLLPNHATGVKLPNIEVTPLQT